MEVATNVGYAPTKEACTKPLPWSITTIHTRVELSNHPDKTFVKQLIHDLQHDCNIAYLGPQFAHLANNLASASRQLKVIDAALQKECEAGRILGQFESPPLPNFCSSGLDLVHKNDGECRVIYHLSAPALHSINDYINPDCCFLTYCTTGDAYSIINRLGHNALLSKIDIKDAFRLIPVCPEDWNLLGIQRRRHFYADRLLPFGLHSAPFLFDRLSNAIHWVLKHSYGVAHLLHYLDDFFTARTADINGCLKNLTAMLSLCSKINAPVKYSKVKAGVNLGGEGHRLPLG